MATHQAQGHAVVYVQDGQIVARKGSFRHHIALANVPITLGGTIAFQVENVLASVAAAWALRVEWTSIEKALASFSNEANNAAGALTCSSTEVPR